MTIPLCFLIVSSTPTFSLWQPCSVNCVVVAPLRCYFAKLQFPPFSFQPTGIQLTSHLPRLLIARFYTAFRETFLRRCGIMSFTVEIRGESSSLQMITENFNILLQRPLTLPKNNCSHYIADCRFARFLITNLLIRTLGFSIIFPFMISPSFTPVLYCASLFARFLLAMSRLLCFLVNDETLLRVYEMKGNTLNIASKDFSL